MQTEGHANPCFSKTLLWAQKSLLCSMFNIIQNGNSGCAVVTKLATGCLEKCTQSERLELSQATQPWPQGLSAAQSAAEGHMSRPSGSL